MSVEAELLAAYMAAGYGLEEAFGLILQRLAKAALELNTSKNA